MVTPEEQKLFTEVGPGTPKAGDALVKMGYCHVRLNDTSRARATWTGWAALWR